MSESEQQSVYLFDGSDSEMLRAHERARETFGYFWRELAWERRRIVPALELACVKVPFSDGEDAEPDDGNPNVEHMWLDEVDFDGRLVSGVLLNSPHWLKSVREGDHASVTLATISDWMFAGSDEVYGAFTVNLMRSRMAPEERNEHDEAWGLSFGDPGRIRLTPPYEPQKQPGLCEEQVDADAPAEHPLSIAMSPSLKERIAEDPSMISGTDDRGWTLLHHQALAGSTATVEVLLDHGADPNAVTDHGMTPLALARSLCWENTATLLISRGGK
jgi:uncharacterized protein YegJ (DUF2314 family)